MLTRRPRVTSPRGDPEDSSGAALPIWVVCGFLLAVAVVISKVPLIEPFTTPVLGALLIYGGVVLIKRTTDEQ